MTWQASCRGCFCAKSIDTGYNPLSGRHPLAWKGAMPRGYRMTSFLVGFGHKFSGDCAQDRSDQIQVDIKHKRLLLQDRADPGNAGEQRHIADGHEYNLLDSFHGPHFLSVFVRFPSDANNHIYCKKVPLQYYMIPSPV